MVDAVESLQSQTLSLDEKRQVIYASLLRFKPEAMELRQRALERVVLTGLMGSSESESYRIDKIQRNLKKTARGPEIREEMVREALNQLNRSGKVKRFEHKSHKSYCLTSKGEAEITHALNQAVDIFQPVLTKMLKDLDHLIPRDLGETLCRSFIMECFARFGRQIAHSVVGRLDREDLASSSEVENAFVAAVGGRNLQVQTRESLHNRCLKFLRSSEPEDEQLKLRLTQGFFLAELLCIHGVPFDPLSAQAFTGAVLYLDTNIVLLGVLSALRRVTLFEEMLRIAVKLGIQLNVTRATIDETRLVLAKKREDLEKYIDKVPDVLTGLTHDPFLSAYLEAKQREPTLEPAVFLDRFDRLTNMIQEEWKLMIDDRNEDEILMGRKFDKESAILQEEAMVIRGGDAKSERVLLHDVAHLAVILDGRSTNPKMWFLTTDRSLVRAATRLVGQASTSPTAAPGSPELVGSPASLPFCFSLAGFLQSISPFTSSAVEEGSLADIFSGLVNEYLSRSDHLFDMREMNLLVEWHEDVMMTPQDELVPALDYVKKRVLEGRQYRVDDLPKVALELKKFLTKSVEERERALRTEAERRAEEIRKEQAARADAENAARLKDAENRELIGKLAELDSNSRQQRQNIAELTETLRQEKLSREQQDARQLRESERSRSQRLRERMFGGFIAGVILWLLTETIMGFFASKGVNGQTALAIRLVISGTGTLLFCLPALLYVRSIQWSSEAKIASFGVTVFLAFVSSRLLTDEAISKFASLGEIAMAISGIAYLFVTRNEKTPIR
jgi:hypothetical protein